MADNLELKVVFSAVDKFLRPVNAITSGARAASKELRATRDALKALNDQQKLVDNFRSTNKALGIDSAKLEQARAKVKGIADAMAATAAPSAQMQRSFAAARDEAAKLSANVNRLAENKQRLRQQLTAVGIDTKQLAAGQRDLKSKIAEATGAVNKQSEALESANKKMQRMKAAQADLGKSQQMAGKLGGAGAGMLAGGVAAGLPVAAAAKAYADFETAMLGVARQVDGARDANGRYTKTYFEMADGIKAMSEKLPMTAGEIAKIVEAGARMGIQGKENLLIFAETTAVMASAFDLPVEQVGDDIGKISQLYKIPIKDIKALGDTINFLDDNALSKGGDIIEVMKRIAGTADMVKMSFGDAAALGSTFLSLGSTAEVAATASNAMMRELSVATMQGKRFQGGLEMLKLKAGDLQLGMSKDSTGTIIKVLEAIKQLPEEQQLEAATRLFGKEFGDDAAKLASNMDEYRRQLALVNDEKAKGSMQRESDTRNNSVNARMDMAKNALGNLSSDLGESMRPAIVATLEAVLSVAQGMRNWAKENPQLAASIMTVVRWLAVALTVFGGITLAAAAIIGPLAMVKFGISALGISGFSAMSLLGRGFNIITSGLGFIGRALLMNPIGLIITGIAVGAFMIYKYWEPIKGFFGGLWDQVKQAFNGGLAGISALITNWSPIGLFYQAFAAVMSYFGIELPSKFTEFGANLMNGLVSGITNGIQAAKDAIGSAGDAVVGFFKEKLGIKSPSRVFAELGGFTMQGLEQGLMGGEDGPLSAVGNMAKKLAGIGAGIAIGGAAMAGDIPLDARPPIGASDIASSASAPMQVVINIYGAPGQDVNNIQRQVEQALANVEARRAAQQRSRLRDTE